MFQRSNKHRRTGSSGSVRITARNGGRAGHEQRAEEMAKVLFRDMERAERRRVRQNSTSSSTAGASTRGRQDSHQSNLSGFFTPPTEVTNKTESDGSHPDSAPKARRVALWNPFRK